jgi:hypothetical protein
MPLLVERGRSIALLNANQEVIATTHTGRAQPIDTVRAVRLEPNEQRRYQTLSDHFCFLLHCPIKRLFLAGLVQRVRVSGKIPHDESTH